MYQQLCVLDVIHEIIYNIKDQCVLSTYICILSIFFSNK